MSDLNNKQWLVDPTKEVELKWISMQIQEKKSRIVRYNQDIDDIKNGEIVRLETEIIMAKKELLLLQEKYGTLKNCINIE